MDEKHIGPSIDTNPEQLYVTDGLYLSGKAVPVIDRSWVQFPGLAGCGNPGMCRDTQANFFPCFFLLCCALILSPFLEPPKNAGVVQPQSSILKNGMVQPGWGASGNVPFNTNTTHIG